MLLCSLNHVWHLTHTGRYPTQEFTHTHNRHYCVCECLPALHTCSVTSAGLLADTKSLWCFLTLTLVLLQKLNDGTEQEIQRRKKTAGDVAEESKPRKNRVPKQG